ncbi:MAG TPA: hypothetical protein VEO18_06260 [Thermoplasmata archaeon]|nr:hypothetical protein [Thermoplasmata archaeon]
MRRSHWLLHPPGIVGVFIDVIALAASLIGLNDALKDMGKVVFGRVTTVLAGISTVESAVSLVGDLVRASKGE